MDYNEEELKLLIEKLNLEENIELSDIPSIPLYMDQVISLFEDNLNGLKRYDGDKIITKTMINNYSKAKLLYQVKNKKYTKENIILLILIYNLKQIISINDIGLLFSNLLNENNEDITCNTDLNNIYEKFLEIKKDQAESLNKNLEDKLNLIKEKTSEFKSEDLKSSSLILTVLSLINESNNQKRLAEKIIDEFFSKDTSKK